MKPLERIIIEFGHESGLERKRRNQKANLDLVIRLLGDLYCINYTAATAKFKIFCYFVFSKLGEILEGEAFIETAKSSEL